jgi:hypothetical protein
MFVEENFRQAESLSTRHFMIEKTVFLQITILSVYFIVVTAIGFKGENIQYIIRIKIINKFSK